MSGRRGPGIHGLKRDTRDQLRYLATKAIEALGVKDPSEVVVTEEMARQFTMIARTAPSGVDADKWIGSAIARALSEYAESDR